MFDREFAQLAKVLQTMADDMAGARAVLERAVQARAGDPTIQEAWWGPVYGSALVAPAASVVLWTINPPPGFAGELLFFANTVEDPPWDGIRFAIRRGLSGTSTGSPVPNLDSMDSPWGEIGNAQPIRVPFGGNEALSCVARNIGATSKTACAQGKGKFWTVNEGLRSFFTGAR